jgi:hypothetical protein
MHQEADRRRMEIDAEIEQNTLGLNERLQTLDTVSEQPAGQGGRQGDPTLHNSTGRLRPQPPVGTVGPKGDRPLPQGQDAGANGGQSNGGRGNVQIVNKPPRFMSPDEDAGYSPPATPGANNPMTGREFVAGAPQSVNRSMRRMPSMEDLPITGQNQLRAYKAPEGQFKEAEPKKKGGFFSRLTGRGRKQETEIETPVQDQHHNDGAYGAPQRPDDGRLDADQPNTGRTEQPLGQPMIDVASSEQYQDHMGQNQAPYDGQRAPSHDPRYQEKGFVDPSAQEMASREVSSRGIGAQDKSEIVQRGQDQRGQGHREQDERHLQNAQPVGRPPQRQVKSENSKGATLPERPLESSQGEYDLRMEEHYKMHPSSAPEQSAGDPALKGQSQTQEEWAPSRPETPAERYPTLELNKSGIGSLPLDEEESIADIPPFLKEKRKG